MDPNRVVVCGRQSAGTVAILAGFRYAQLVRGVAAATVTQKLSQLSPAKKATVTNTNGAKITVKEYPGVLLDVTFDNNGDLDRESYIVEVKDGYARNFLLPRNLALPVSFMMTRPIEKLDSGLVIKLLLRFDEAFAELHQFARLIDVKSLEHINDPEPTEKLIAECVQGFGERKSWIVEALSHEDQIGLIMMEMGSKNLKIYSEIRRIISSALQGTVLFKKVSGQTLNLQKQSDALQKNVDYLRKIMGAVIQTLAMTVETKDPYTAGHERRVADLSRTIAMEMGLTKDQVEAIRLSAIVHDLGKLYVPSEILNKPGKLRDAEFTLIKLHPEIAYDILKNIEFPWPLAEIVYNHHERLDGSGYPRGLKGDEINMETRIISVADVVEAIASHRPYRPSLGIEVALDEIRQKRGIYYDPDVVDICLKLFNEKGYTLKA